ncbi:hypothetical protein T484DRAFT_1857397, partial [Baffinella frigidus]
VLNLSGNNLEQLPPVIPQSGAVFGVMDKLRVLDVSGNFLERLPLDICTWEEGEGERGRGRLVLNLSGNNLEQLPPVIPQSGAVFGRSSEFDGLQYKSR